MSKWKLEQWCVHATSRIRYGPDRKAVYKELREHADDRYENLLARNNTEVEAADQTLEAMGDAREVSAMLEKVHRPFWGYLYSISRTLFLALLILFVIRALTTSELFVTDPNADNYFDSSYVGGHERVFCTEPNVSVSCDGYTITLSKAALWRTNLSGADHETMEHLIFRLDIRNPRPWAKPADIMDWIWAEDSAGTHYPSHAENLNHDTVLYGNPHATGRFTVSYVMHLGWHLPEDVEWVDLHYTRDGRDWTIRIDLTGGNNT